MNQNLMLMTRSLFTIAKDKQESADVLNHDLSLVFTWAFNWKIFINPDTNKPREVLFSRKMKTQNHPNISLNNTQVERISHQKHLGIYLMKNLISKNISTIYQELGLESLRARRWYKRLSCMFKIVKEEAPNYLINLISKIQ